MLDRTFLRPRDVIHFFNICLKNSVDKTAIVWDAIKSAELEYSKSRLDSLFDEWKENYPYLDKVFLLFKKFESPFSIDDVSNEQLQGLIETIYYNQKNGGRDTNWLDHIVQSYLESGDSAFPAIRLEVFNVLYVVGFLGVTANRMGGIKYSFLPNGNLMPEEVHADMTLHIHPAFHRALNVRPNN
jgi:hypothetical protein